MFYTGWIVFSSFADFEAVIFFFRKHVWLRILLREGLLVNAGVILCSWCCWSWKVKFHLKWLPRWIFSFWEFQIFGCSTWKPLHSTQITILLVCAQAPRIVQLNSYLYVHIYMEGNSNAIITRKSYFKKNNTVNEMANLKINSWKDREE